MVCYLLSFGVNGVFLETRFFNNDRVFLSTRTKFRILLYFSLVTDFYLVTELEMVLEKNQSANHTESYLNIHPPLTEPSSGEGIAPRHRGAECQAWEDGPTAVCGKDPRVI